jgi:acyl dehydratase
MTYQVSYTAKDLILYALSLGMGSTKNDADDLKYLFENHDEFSAVPTFYLALTFWAVAVEEDNKFSRFAFMNGIPAFPPPIMNKEQVIPKRFLKHEATCLSNFPVIHTWQSISWHDLMKIPKRASPRKRHDECVTVSVDMDTISVQPKSIGTFVTTQTQIRDTSSDAQVLVSMQSTALVMGISPDEVLPYDAGIPRQSMMKDSMFFANRKQQSNNSLLLKPDFEWSYQTTPSQALLYRLASGDSNRIHVDTFVSKMMLTPNSSGDDTGRQPAPIMHGLFTLALAFRGITKCIQSIVPELQCDVQFRRLEGKFTRPVFVGDTLCVKIWNDASLFQDASQDGSISGLSMKRFAFVIVNPRTNWTVVDCGCVELEITTVKGSNKIRSRL